MFEEQTMDVILDRMLENVDDSLDKREGSVVYDMLAPAALEFSNAYQMLEMVLNEGFADTSSFEYLIKRAAENGILVKSATKAKVVLKTTPEDIDIPFDTTFFGGNYTYTIHHIENDSTYILECQTEGTEPNTYIGTLVPSETVEGLQTCEIDSIFDYGEDEETEDDLRLRYFARFDSFAFSGNRKDYEEKINAIDNVGGCHCLRNDSTNPDYNVKVYIVDSDFNVPSAELLQKVKNEVDPEDGDGSGLAPFDHKVLIAAAHENPVNIDIEISANGLTDEKKSELTAAIDELIVSKRAEWTSNETTKIKKIEVENLLSQFDYVDGVYSLEFTNPNASKGIVFETEKYSLPSKGAISWTER